MLQNFGKNGDEKHAALVQTLQKEFEPGDKNAMGEFYFYLPRLWWYSFWRAPFRGVLYTGGAFFSVLFLGGAILGAWAGATGRAQIAATPGDVTSASQVGYWVGGRLGAPALQNTGNAVKFVLDTASDAAGYTTVNVDYQNQVPGAQAQPGRPPAPGQYPVTEASTLPGTSPLATNVIDRQP